MCGRGARGKQHGLSYSIGMPGMHCIVEMKCRVYRCKGLFDAFELSQKYVGH